MSEWLPIDSARAVEESTSFLVLCPGNDVCDELILQVANFQGDLYPDHLSGNVDWSDRVLSATHWMPLPAPPRQLSPETERGIKRTIANMPDAERRRFAELVRRWKGLPTSNRKSRPLETAKTT